MINVKLIPSTIHDPELVGSHAAKMCYEGATPKFGKLIDIESRIWATGHHTVLQHSYFTFAIEGISVGDVTMGLHLASPFYNTSQRSGRFCGSMFSVPDYNFILGYINAYWPDLPASIIAEIMSYIKHGLKVYGDNIVKATRQAADFIREERPNAIEAYIEQNAPKIAQEQLRVFVPVIFPTALDFTLNLSALAALYRVAWSPPMKDVTQKMADIVVGMYPRLEYLFRRQESRGSYDAGNIMGHPENALEIMTKPAVGLFSAGVHERFVAPDADQIHPLDLLHFDPRFMDNNVEEIKTWVKVSLATMGQDQRHRTVRRGHPAFTGNFYLPPVPVALGLDALGREVYAEWFNIYGLLLKNNAVSLARILAPYGATVVYRKSASYNAATHEGAKRLCWCAQEEIYHAFQGLRRQIAKYVGNQWQFLNVTAPHCVLTGKCGEGTRYCGRDLKRLQKDPFPERKI